MRVGLYVRVSTEEQKLHGLSIEAQLAALNEWAKAERVKVIDRYVDAGLSARKPAAKRPELQRLLRDIEAGKIDLVVFTKLDRWFRSVSEYYKVQEVLVKHNANWKALHEDYDTLTASGRLKINIMLAVAQDEADRTSERIKAVFERKKQRGEPVSGIAPLGYIVADKKMTIDLDKAPMVKDMFREYIALRSVSATQRYMRATYALNYDISTIKRLLRNTKYIGEAYGVDEFCEPMIDKVSFKHVQEILSERAQRHANSPQGRIYLFKGLLFCVECGHSMTACVCKGHYYYRCTRRAFVGDCGFDKYVREDAIEAYLIENILKHCAEYNAAAMEGIKNKPQIDDAGIKRKMAKLKDLYLSDLIMKDEYERDYVALRAALDEAQNAIAPEPVLIDVEAVRRAMATYAELDRPRRKEFWSRALRKIIARSDGSFSFTLRNT